MIKLPNNGNPTLIEDVPIFRKPTLVYLNYIETQYLLRTRELRWMLQGNNELSGSWGDKKTFSFIVAVDDSGSAVFSSLTQSLTVDASDRDLDDVQHFHLRYRSGHR